MKTQEQYTEDYIEYLYGNYGSKSDRTQTAIDFNAGFNLAEELFKPKWISVDEQNPDNDRQVIVYVRNHKTPWWSGNHFGSYINEKWYLEGGVKEEFEVVKWAEIPQEKELKTIKEWSKIFNKIIVLDYDGFKDLPVEEKISEWDFVSRLTRCTISI